MGRFTVPAYTFGPSWQGTFGPKTDLEVIFTSISNIVTTERGTIPHRPSTGSEVPRLVFDPNDSITRASIRYFVQRDISRQDPRVSILTVRTEVPHNEPHTVIITVAFAIIGDPRNRVFSAPVEFNTLSLAS